MTPRARVQAALAFQAADKVPLQIFEAPGGLYKHGKKLRDLTAHCGHGFGSLNDLRVPDPPPTTDFDLQGSYHAIRTDE